LGHIIFFNSSPAAISSTGDFHLHTYLWAFSVVIEFRPHYWTIDTFLDAPSFRMIAKQPSRHLGMNLSRNQTPYTPLLSLCQMILHAGLPWGVRTKNIQGQEYKVHFV
jgi:hypothetical protein